MSDKPVLLRMKGSKESKPFDGAHAKRLLAYPNPQWEEVADKEPAAKAKAPNTPPAGDATGQPTSI